MRLVLVVVTALVGIAAVAPGAFAVAPPPVSPLSAAPNPFTFLLKPALGTVIFTNTTPFLVGIIGVHADSAPGIPSVDFTVGFFGPSCLASPPLSPGASCNVDFLVSAFALPGAHAALVVDSTFGPSFAELRYGPAGPAAQIAPTSYNFGAVAVGATSAVALFTVTNDSSSPATISPSVGSDYALAGGTCGSSLASFASCTYGVTFSASHFGMQAGNLDVIIGGGPTFVRATLSGIGYVIQPNAGSQAGGYVLAGGPNIDSNRDKFEWAIRERADGTLYGKDVTYRFTEAGVRYVARVALSAIPFGAFYVSGSHATFDGSATLATVSGAIETPVAGTYFLHVESDDLIAGSNNGAGFDRVFIQIGSSSGPLHQTGSGASPAVITWGAVGNGFPWVV